MAEIAHSISIKLHDLKDLTNDPGQGIARLKSLEENMSEGSTVTVTSKNGKSRVVSIFSNSNNPDYPQRRRDLKTCMRASSGYFVLEYCRFY